MNTYISANFKTKYSELLKNHPFSYDLGVKIISSPTPSKKVTICCHGYGQNSEITSIIDYHKVIEGCLIGFNFPDYNITQHFDHKTTTFGTIEEILPLIFILKKTICDLHLSSINLYGFSAGGGAIINTLAALNQTTYDENLANIGIAPEDKKKIITALEKGIIILDCPLKSMEEIIEIRDNNPQDLLVTERYKKNNMRPIDAIEKLYGLSLTIFLHFQNPDEILSNRDDNVYSDKLRNVNKGKTFIFTSFDGGHNTFHASLWNFIKKINL